MPSTRARLTISYAFVLLGTMVAFGVALAIGRSKEALQLQLGQEAFRVADNVLYTIQSAQLASKRLTFVDSTSGPTQVIKSTKELADVLDPLPGYFMVLDQGGKLLYSSGLMRLLSGDDQTALLRSVMQLVDETGGVIVPVRGDSLHLLEVTRRNVLVGGNISRVVAALPTKWVAHCHCTYCRRAHGAPGRRVCVERPSGLLRCHLLATQSARTRAAIRPVWHREEVASRSTSRARCPARCG